ncbi:MAG: efflux RND transporter permease subunit [Pirellulales bacterium]|nr:efflux RND transporter permease subunit [Pirellulales bacterium]
MLNAIIKLSLRYRVITIALALVLTVYGSYELYHLPIDVFPDLNRPRVTIMTEALGLAPEEVETLITFPLESSLNGATGVQAVRSASGVGLSVINVEFAWGTDIYIDRQIVAEKLALAADRLPAGVKPQMAPISSIMGQVLQVGMYSKTGKTDPIELRTLADWVVRQRLLTIPGVAQVITMGGGRKQYQVLVNEDELLKYDVTLEEVEQAVKKSNSNATGGYLDSGGKELLVRAMGRIKNIQDLNKIVIKSDSVNPISLGQVARVREAAQVKRGDAAVDGDPAVMIVIAKQPGSDTRKITTDVIKALNELKASLPPDVIINSEVYQQKEFIDLSIHNVIEALRDGGILVVIILFLFLMNFRTTFITLTAIPLSIVVTGLVFKWSGMTINTMTLGGLAVAIGELVDDAIVDVENIFRRLKENKHAANPKSALLVVYEASSEVRNSIVFSTILVVLVFVPLFALGGMEGRLFTPLGIAYIVSIIASLVVSLTVTPVLSYWLLPNAKFMGHDKDGFLLRFLKWVFGFAIRFSLRYPVPILATVSVAVLVSVIVVSQLGRDFLPPFNEGSVQVNVLLSPGTSLATSNQIAAMVDERIGKIKGVTAFGRRTGRAELDEHAEGVNVSEIIISFDPNSGRSREEVLEELREELTQIPGVVISAEQPLAHLISHMLSGVKAQVGIKLYGDDLNILRQKADEMKAAMADIPGVKDLQVEQQTEIPQLQIQLDRDSLLRLGLTADYVNEFIESALNGKVVSEIVLGERKFDLVVRLDDEYRQDPERLRRLSINLPSGGRIPLAEVASIRLGSGPNTINRENVRRRIVIQCNTAGRDLNSVVTDIQTRLAKIQESLPTGYFIEYGGQFESQKNATRMIGLLSLISLAAMFLALYTLFHSTNLALQVLSALPMAAIGAVAALVVTRQTLTVASMVGFISLSGIASRNGILLIAHYLHLVRHEGEQFTKEMIERAGLERLAPMLMTALTAGIALIPLVLAAGEPGKEILYPVATVILGGLISSTLLDFFVHPALFWCFGRGQAEKMMNEAQNGDELAHIWDEQTSVKESPKPPFSQASQPASNGSLEPGNTSAPPTHASIS